jgi:hypothetical protein
MISGTGAINEQGVRFSKGHGFFDAECGIVWDLLDSQKLATIPPLQELQAMEASLPPLGGRFFSNR